MNTIQNMLQPVTKKQCGTLSRAVVMQTPANAFRETAAVLVALSKTDTHEPLKWPLDMGESICNVESFGDSAHICDIKLP